MGLLTRDGYACSWQLSFFYDLALWFQGKRKGQSIGSWERKPSSGPVCFVFSLYCIHGVFPSFWVDKTPKKHILKHIKQSIKERRHIDLMIVGRAKYTYSISSWRRWALQMKLLWIAMMVGKNFLKNAHWMAILKQFMKKRGHYTAMIVGKLFSKTVIKWVYWI